MTHLDTDIQSRPNSPYQRYLERKEKDMMEASQRIEDGMMFKRMNPETRAALEGYCLGWFEQGYEAASRNHTETRFLGKRRKKKL